MTVDFAIKLNQEQDAREFKNFLGTEMVKQWYPEVKTKDDVDYFIKQTYTQDKNSLKKRVLWLESIKPDLQFIADRLSDLMREEWNEIKTVTIYPSVCPICPRFLETSSFMVNYKFYRPDIYSVCAHEMIHMLYFKHLEKKLGSLEKETPSLDWKLSEIFVPCVLNDEAIKDFTGYDGGVFGVDLDEDKIKQIQSLWQGNLVEYRNKGLEILKSPSSK